MGKKNLLSVLVDKNILLSKEAKPDYITVNLSFSELLPYIH
jgi:hypothetical protein